MRHNKFSSEAPEWLELTVGMDPGFGHFNLPANLGGQLVVTGDPSDQGQVLCRCSPRGAVSNLTVLAPYPATTVAAIQKVPHKDCIE